MGKSIIPEEVQDLGDLVHYSPDNETTVCGQKPHFSTIDKNFVTCLECIEEIK